MMKWKKTAALLAAVLLMAAMVAGEAEARGKRVGQIPNGGIDGCNTCHTSGAGTARNAFGMEIENGFLDDNGDVIWGVELAALDSDGDGASNGLELGDPDGTWVADDADPENAFHPGDPDSTPPLPEPEPTAVERSSWAQIKALIGE